MFVIVLILAAGGLVGAGSPCLENCEGDPACLVEWTYCQLSHHRAGEAIERLKALVEKQPGRGVLVRCLARAYLADENTFWAQKVLQSAGDCQSRSWLAWIAIGQGYLDLARETLARPGCPATASQMTRWLLLEAFIARTAGEGQAALAAIRRASRQEEMFPEDQELLNYLRRQEDDSFLTPLRLRLDLAGGYTSNATAGLPTDPGEPGPQSALGRLELMGTLVWPLAGRYRPGLEFNLRGHGLAARPARRESYLETAVRPEIIMGRGTPRVTVGYQADGLLVNQEEYSLFYHGHRGEAELELGSWTAFVGTGYRVFEEQARTRFELDGGAGGGFTLFDRLQVLLATMARYHRADREAYDLVGATALMVLRTPLGADFNLRLLGSFGSDYFLNSGGDGGESFFGTRDKRFEIFSRLSAGVWSPALRGIRLGITYDLSWRDSTADTSRMDFDFLEHRALVTLRWTLEMNPWDPDRVSPAVPTPLDYGLSASASGLGEERIQDLLRQDEADRRGACGCGS